MQAVALPMHKDQQKPRVAPDWDPCITGSVQYGVSVGYWLLLPPLTPGQHTLQFGAPSAGQDITTI
jgi:hypothetical protein